MEKEQKKSLIIETGPDQTMSKHAIIDFPNECCGFLYGHETDTERVITLAKQVDNSKKGDQRRRFEISAFDYMKAENFALQNKLSLLGVYHSHPQHPAIASETDLQSALPYFSYVIYSVIDRVIADVKSWQLNETTQQFDEEKVNLLELNHNK